MSAKAAVTVSGVHAGAAGVERYAIERAIRLLPIQTIRGPRDDEDIGPAVVVVVACHGSEAITDRRVDAPRPHDTALVVRPQGQTGGRREHRIEVAVSVCVHQRHASARIVLSKHRGGRIDEASCRRFGIDELDLESCGYERLAIASLLQIGVRVGDSCRIVAQRLKAPHRRFTSGALASAYQRRGQTVRRGRIEWFPRQRGFEERRGVCVPPLCGMELRELYAASHVFRIDIERALKCRRRVGRPVRGACDQSGDVVAMRRARRGRDEGVRVDRCGVMLAIVEPGDRQVEPGDGRGWARSSAPV